MYKVLIIGLGGFVGAVARFIIAGFLNEQTKTFSLGTFLVNVAGSFFIALIIYSLQSGKIIPGDLQDFLIIGFLGSFTTMSTFSFETFRLVELRTFSTAFFYFFATFAGCLFAVWLGRKVAMII